MTRFVNCGTACGLATSEEVVGLQCPACSDYDVTSPQDINAVEEAKKNLAARGNPMPEGYCQVVLMRPARGA